MTDPITPLRRQLAAEIVRALGPGAQHDLAPKFGIPQPRMSELNRGKVERCSMEWLIRRIDRLGGSVTISVTLGDVVGEWRRALFRATRERRAALLAEAQRRAQVAAAEAEARPPATHLP